MVWCEHGVAVVDKEIHFGSHFVVTFVFIMTTNTEFLLQTLQRKQRCKKIIIGHSRLIRTKAPNFRVNTLQSNATVSLRTQT